MSPDGSVTHLVHLVKGGDPEALAGVWERYYRRLAGLARAKLAGRPGLPADEEDVALSALDSFYRRAADGRFPDLHDRDDLWRLLAVIAVRKAYRLVRDAGRDIRGGGAVLGEGALGPGELEAALGREPTPAVVAQAADEWARLLAALTDADQKLVATRTLEGFTHGEIAEELGCSTRTVRRKWQEVCDRAAAELDR